MAYGQLGTLQLAAQSSYGTLNVSSLRALPLVSETLKFSIAQLQETGLYGRFGDGPRSNGLRSSAGRIAFEPMPGFLGTLLYAACGQVTTTSAGGVQTHRFRPRNTSDWDDSAALPPFTALVHRDVASAMAYYDLCADKLTLDAANGMLLKGTVDWVGANYSDAAKVAPAFPAESPWAWNQGSATYGGGALGGVRRFTLTQQNRLQPIYALGTASTPSAIKRSGAVNVTGQMTLLFQSNSMMADFLAQPERQLLLNFQTTVASPAMLRVDVPNLRITDYGPAISGPGVIELPVSWAADFATGSGYQIEYTLTNTMPAYP
jgi:hypothetical protein